MPDRAIQTPCYLVRCVGPGDEVFEGLPAGDVFVLADPALADAPPSATAVCVAHGEGTVDISVTAGAGIHLVTRLLISVCDALRSRGTLRARIALDGLRNDITTALAPLGFRRRGDWLELDL